MYNSQELQDKFLQEFVFRSFKKGFFVDVGAHNGVKFNNTKYFEDEHEWTGINFEPHSVYFKELNENRPNNINLNYAISDVEGELNFYENIGYGNMISGLVDTYNEQHLKRLKDCQDNKGCQTKIVKVKTKLLSDILQQYNVNNINYLSIDVEGAEFNVIKSIDFDKVFIDVIGFENNNYDNTYIKIINYLKKYDYKIIQNYKGLDIFMIHKNSKFINTDLKLI